MHLLITFKLFKIALGFKVRCYCVFHNVIAAATTNELFSHTAFMSIVTTLNC